METVMSQQSKDWRDEIWTKFEALFDRSAPHATGLWSVPDGWRETVEGMLARTADIVRADGIGRMTVTRLAQRDGQAEIAYVTESIRLRILIDAGIDRSSARLACTCGVCGAAAERYPRAEGSVARCPVHRPPGGRRDLAALAPDPDRTRDPGRPLAHR
jgi:hypothetical protein